MDKFRSYFPPASHRGVPQRQATDPGTAGPAAPGTSGCATRTGTVPAAWSSSARTVEVGDRPGPGTGAVPDPAAERDRKQAKANSRAMLDLLGISGRAAAMHIEHMHGPQLDTLLRQLADPGQQAAALKMLAKRAVLPGAALDRLALADLAPAMALPPRQFAKVAPVLTRLLGAVLARDGTGDRTAGLIAFLRQAPQPVNALLLGASTGNPPASREFGRQWEAMRSAVVERSGRGELARPASKSAAQAAPRAAAAKGPLQDPLDGFALGAALAAPARSGRMTRDSVLALAVPDDSGKSPRKIADKLDLLACLDIVQPLAEGREQDVSLLTGPACGGIADPVQAGVARGLVALGLVNPATRKLGVPDSALLHRQATACIAQLRESLEDLAEAARREAGGLSGEAAATASAASTGPGPGAGTGRSAAEIVEQVRRQSQEVWVSGAATLLRQAGDKPLMSRHLGLMSHLAVAAEDLADMLSSQLDPQVQEALVAVPGASDRFDPAVDLLTERLDDWLGALRSALSTTAGARDVRVEGLKRRLGLPPATGEGGPPLAASSASSPAKPDAASD